MAATGFHVFDTAIGPCGIAWGERGIVGVALPGTDPDATRAQLERKHPGAVEAPPPPQTRRAVESITALLRGEPVELFDVQLDMERIGPLERRIYEALRTVPAGRTVTYGELAEMIGEPASARAVGQAMGSNPFPIVVPCHRVLGANGKLGGFSAPGGVDTKLKILNIERATGGGEPSLFDDLPLAAGPRRS